MQLYILVILITATHADNHCRGIYFKGNYYNVDVIREGISGVHQIAYKSSEDTLYFTFDQIAKVPTRALGYLNLKTNKAGVINGVRNATGLTIDTKKNRIYVGGADGLYFLNNANVPKKLPSSQNIKYLFFKDVVYFINTRGEAYRFEDGTVNNVNELINVAADQMVIDDNNNIFFLRDNHLFSVKIGTRAINTHEKYFVTAIATDKYYKPFICTNDGVFMYNKYKYVLDKVANNVNDLRALTFSSNDEPIYIIVDNVVKLTYNPVPCFGD